MSRYKSLRLALPILMAAVALPLAARGQSQDSQSQSVAEAARRTREQKKAASKPTPVVTDDTLKPATPTAQGTPDSSNVPAAPSAPAVNPENVEQAKKDSAEVAALKEQLAEAKKGLDLLQRDFALQQDTFYLNPAHDRDPAGKAKLDEMKQQIADKQQEVDALKARLAALQESSKPPATATPPAAPSQA